MEKIIEKVYSFIVEHELVKPKEKIIVGLSGGPDSVFLLYALLEIKNKLDITLSAVHINHLLRGEESFRDEEFSVSLANKLGVPIKVYRVRVEQYAKAKKIGIEESARELRYRIYAIEAERNNAKVALGHTADDRVETFLFNIIRGSGISGLKSIPKKRDFIIRPIIHIWRREIWNFLKQKGIEFVLDSSNLSLFYTRNQIRRTLIPNLEQFNPRVKEHIYHTTEIFEDLDRYIEEEAESIIKSALLYSNEQIIFLDKTISNLPLALFGEIIRKSAEKLGFGKIRFNFYIISTIKMANKGVIELASNQQYKLTVERTRKGYLMVQSPHWNPKEYQNELSNELHLPNKLGVLTVKKIKADEIELKHDDETIGYIKEPDTPLKVRFPKEGDRFHPFGAKNETKLARYMLERAIPRTLRSYIPVILAGEEIAWVCGLGISEKFKVEPENRYALKLEWQSNIANFLKRRDLWKR